MITLLTCGWLAPLSILATTATGTGPALPKPSTPAGAVQTTAVPDTPEVAWPDSVTLASGTVVPCRVVESTPEALVIE